jgi:hypothetical protein
VEDIAQSASRPELRRPAIFALVVAIGLGVLWGETTFTREPGPVYWPLGLGLVVGFTVRVAARGRRDWPVGLVALLASSLGVLISKYLVFFGELIFTISRTRGDGAADGVSVTLLGHPGVFWQFLGHLPEFVHVTERSWILGGVVLAVGIALLPGRAP